MAQKQIHWVWIAVVLSVLGGCAGEAGSVSEGVTVDTLANGAVSRTYAVRPDVPTWRIVEDLRIGQADGPPEVVFGDVRDVAMEPTGTLLVLDAQAKEVRRFDAEGRYLETVVTEGQGPREVVNANGIQVDPDGTIWVLDHGNWRILGLHPDGTDTTDRMASLSFGRQWEGGVADGWEWGTASGTNYESRPGLNESPYSAWMVGAELGTPDPDRARDSVFVGRGTAVFVVAERGSFGIQFTGSQAKQGLDLAGAVWFANNLVYELTKVSLQGDTLAVVRLPRDSVPLPRAELDSAVSRATRFSTRLNADRVDVEPLMHRTYPAFEDLLVDDQSRLWVARTRAGGVRVWDVFGPDGELLAVAEADFELPPFYRPTIQGDRFLTMVRDDLDVPYALVGRIVRE